MRSRTRRSDEQHEHLIAAPTPLAVQGRHAFEGPRTQPERPRPFRVPFVWPVGIGSAAACLFIMQGLPRSAWERFGLWLLLGLVPPALYELWRGWPLVPG